MAIRGGDETGDWLDFYVPLGALDHAGLEYWDGRSFFSSSVTDDWLAAIGTEVLVERAVAEFGRIDILVSNAAYQTSQPVVVGRPPWELGLIGFSLRHDSEEVCQ
ncbi:hypothetical protein ACWGA9_18625 [Streptomyces sp. NPDC054950]